MTHSVSIGLPVPQRVVGALNIYASTQPAPSEETIALAQAFASYAGVAVANAALYNYNAELADQMTGHCFPMNLPPAAGKGSRKVKLWWHAPPPRRMLLGIICTAIPMRASGELFGPEAWSVNAWWKLT